MKPVYKCDYCSEMGTKEEIREHEIICMKNYDRRSCHTCKHKKSKYEDGTLVYECDVKELAKGTFFEFCESYEKGEIIDDSKNASTFGFNPLAMFGMF